VRRGEVWLVALDPTVGSEQAKTRPCVIVQRDAANKSKANTTIIVPFTNATNKLVTPARPLIKAGNGLSKDSIGLCDQIRVIDRLRLRGTKLGSLTETSMHAINVGLLEILDLTA
jgi:mRNA interferase MazF